MNDYLTKHCNMFVNLKSNTGLVMHHIQRIRTLTMELVVVGGLDLQVDLEAWVAGRYQVLADWGWQVQDDRWQAVGEGPGYLPWELPCQDLVWAFHVLALQEKVVTA